MTGTRTGVFAYRAASQKRRQRRVTRDLLRAAFARAVQYWLILIILILMFVPIVLMIAMSLRQTTLIYADFWGFEFPPYLKNYAVTLFDLWLPLLRTLVVITIACFARLLIAAVAAYAFARMRMFGRAVIFQVFVLLVMMIPPSVLLASRYMLATELGLRGSLVGLAITYSLLQAFPIFMLTTFFRNQPAEIFESAKVDGANDWQSLWRIAAPIARPIFVTIAIMDFIWIYGDLIWPSLMLSNENKTMILALLSYNPMVSERLNRPDLGPMTAGYVFGSIPPLILFIVGMRYYIAGLTSGAVKN